MDRVPRVGVPTRGTRLSVGMGFLSTKRAELPEEERTIHACAAVVLAMSGGVDSSVAAYLLQASRATRSSACSCAPAPTAPRTTRRRPQEGLLQRPGCRRRPARRRSARHSVLRPRFRAAISTASWTTSPTSTWPGRTPNPCVVCNNWLKFGKLWAYGKQLEADFVATGHYAQIVPRGRPKPSCTGPPIPDKDQSYVLFGLRRGILPHLLFPDRRLSQGGGPRAGPRGRAGRGRQAGQRRDLLRAGRRSRRASSASAGRELATAGRIVDTAGKVLAEHDGIEKLHDRPAQGAGLRRRRAAATCCESCPADNEVVVGDREELAGLGIARLARELADRRAADRDRCRAGEDPLSPRRRRRRR